MKQLDYTRPYYFNDKAHHVVGEAQVYYRGMWFDMVQVRECIEDKTEYDRQKVKPKFYFRVEFDKKFAISADPNDPAIHIIYRDNP